MRSSCQIAVYVDIAKSMTLGLQWYRSANGVLLCPGDRRGLVPPSCFEKVVDLSTGENILAAKRVEAKPLLRPPPRSASLPSDAAGPAQPFDYYCVLDFEATCQEGGTCNPQEIIELPTVLIEASTMTVVDEFQTYVRPAHNPKLSAFCTGLTGIQQQWVDSAPVFEQALDQHTAWLKQHGLAVEGAVGHSFAFVTCGDWDLRTMLPMQLRLARDRRVPQHFKQWINIKRVYSQHASHGARKASGMAGMLRGLGLTLTGRHHSGIDDCRNIAKIAIALAARGAELHYTTGGAGRGGPEPSHMRPTDGCN